MNYHRILRERIEANNFLSPSLTWFLSSNKKKKEEQANTNKANFPFYKSQVITIFSASNYYEIGSNKGAYLKLNPQLDTHFVQYTAAASKTRKLTFRQRVGLVESSALRELGARLRERHSELEREFRIRDPTCTGNFSLKSVLLLLLCRFVVFLFYYFFFYFDFLMFMKCILCFRKHILKCIENR